MAAGALRTALNGGNFVANVFGGGLSSGLLASLQAIAMKGWELASEWTDRQAYLSTQHGGVYRQQADGMINTAGTIACLGECESWSFSMGKQGVVEPGEHWFGENSIVHKIFNYTSKVHDFGNGILTYNNGAYIGRGILFNTAFDWFFNMPTMIPAALYTGFAFFGNPYVYSFHQGGNGIHRTSLSGALLSRKVCAFASTLLIATSCTGARYSKATIVPPATGWSVTDKCVDTGCYRKEEFLISNTVTIRVSAKNTSPVTGEFFLIAILLPEHQSGDTEFDPIDSTLVLHNNELTPDKTVSCFGLIFNESDIRSVPGHQGFQRITANHYCFYLVFKVARPSVEETFTLELRGLVRNGQRIDVPMITFQPNR